MSTDRTDRYFDAISNQVKFVADELLRENGIDRNSDDAMAWLAMSFCSLSIICLFLNVEDEQASSFVATATSRASAIQKKTIRDYEIMRSGEITQEAIKKASKMARDR